MSVRRRAFAGNHLRLRDTGWASCVAVSSASTRDTESPTTLTLLVEAERRWRDELAQAERECADLVARSREAIDRAANELEAELATLIEDRRRERRHDIERRIAHQRDDARARADRLRTLDETTLDALTQLVLTRVMWPEGAR